MNKINVGDIVRLKSGGPKMTVEEVYDSDRIKCVWYDKEYHMQTAFVRDCILERCDYPDGDTIVTNHGHTIKLDAFPPSCQNQDFQKLQPFTF